MLLQQSQTKLALCLALALGAATSAEAAISVTFYGSGLATDVWTATTTAVVPTTYDEWGMIDTYGQPAGAAIVNNTGASVNLWKYSWGSSYSVFFRANEGAVGGSPTFWSALAQGSELSVWDTDSSFGGYYHAEAGSDNYMLYDIDGAGSVPDSMARFSFDSAGIGTLLGVASDPLGLSFDDGVQALAAAVLVTPVAATPEPAGFLLGGVPALMGAGALLRRRVRPSAAGI